MESDEERFARTSLSSMKMGDAAAAAVQKTPNRVTLADIEAAILSTYYYSPPYMPHLTIATVVLKNGWAVVGKSAPADADNYDYELGMKFAREDAIRQLWPLMGFALRERLTCQVSPDAVPSRLDQSFGDIDVRGENLWRGKS